MLARFATIFIATIGLSVIVTAQTNPVRNTTHIASIDRDTIVVVSGQTSFYTTVTPEGQVPVSTNPGVQKLIQQIAKSSEIPATWQVLDKQGNPKTEGQIETGDRLTMEIDQKYVRTSSPRKTWYLVAAPLAVSGKLELAQGEIAANKPASIILQYTLGQRTPDATVSIIMPAAVEVILENTTVNIMGKGETLLKDLGANIHRLPSGNWELVLNHLDLRASNGTDIVLAIHSKPLKRENYLFQASYTTAAPAVLTSPGYYPEMAILQVTKGYKPKITDTTGN